ELRLRSSLGETEPKLKAWTARSNLRRGEQGAGGCENTHRIEEGKRANRDRKQVTKPAGREVRGLRVPHAQAPSLRRALRAARVVRASTGVSRSTSIALRSSTMRPSIGENRLICCTGRSGRRP